MSALSMTIEDGVAELVLSRPEALNAISTQLATELAAATDGLRANDTVRVVLLAADGRYAYMFRLQAERFADA